MVPRLSDPAMTRARSTPAIGDSMTCEMNDSHCPLTLPMSIFLVRMSSSMMLDLPIVPAMMTVFAEEPDMRVGPVRFFVGPTVYYATLSDIVRG